MKPISILIHEAISAVCPILGVSIGLFSDKSTWVINFQDNATPAQRTAAIAAMNAFDIVTAQNADIAKLARAAIVETEANADIFMDRLRNSSPDQIKTFVANNVSDLASAKTLITRMAIAIAYLLRND